MFWDVVGYFEISFLTGHVSQFGTTPATPGQEGLTEERCPGPRRATSANAGPPTGPTPTGTTTWTGVEHTTTPGTLGTARKPLGVIQLTCLSDGITRCPPSAVSLLWLSHFVRAYRITVTYLTVNCEVIIHEYELLVYPIYLKPIFNHYPPYQIIWKWKRKII